MIFRTNLSILFFICSTLFDLNIFVVSDCTFSVNSYPYDLSSLSTTTLPGGYYVDPCHKVTSPASNCPLGSNCPAFISLESACFCLGSLSQVTWTASTTFNGVVGTYIGGTGNRNYVAEIECSDSEVAPTSVDTSDGTVFTAHWKSKTACGAGGGGGDGGISAVGIIDLVLVFGFLGFLGAGSVYNWKVKSKTGADVIPFRTVWTDVPFLIKDGCLFLYGVTRATIHRLVGRTTTI
eukprot:c21769_g2_i2.p1 GENE.c21769_g2_i2~~c21769_g2_i2.p1  ORF type:complete len:236 (-),score=84.13 c21769_g2_i2:48-755(-)